MNWKRFLLIDIFVAFGLYSAWVLWEFGYFGLWSAAMANGATIQVTLDLIIACVLICSWMVGDARRGGRNPWPYVALTFGAGSFGPLLYLLMDEVRRPHAAPAAA